MISQAQQAVWALVVVGKDGKGKVLALLSDQYHVQLAQRLADISLERGNFLSPTMSKVSIDVREVSSKEFADLHADRVEL